jgi:pilus assembly protein CpaF
LQYWLEQDGVTDVLVNSPNEAWIERRGRLERVAIDLHTQSGLRGLAVRLAALCGRRLDDAEPICDGALPDGTRFHAVLSPLAANAAVISLRVLRQDRFSLEELQRLQMFPPAWEPLLRNLVSQHANFLIAGGTGSGKTTLLAALLGIANPAQRLITVEEARELAPGLPHHVSLVARRSNVEGAGAVDLADLVRAALRMRPDRLVLGECRGAEVREVLQAMNTGHSGAMATIHANSAEGVPARLEALGALAGLTREAVKAQTFGAIDVVLHVVRENGIRRVAQIGVPVAVDGQLRVEVVATWAGGNNPIVATASWDQLWQRWSV